VREQLALLPSLLTAHLQLTLLALGVATAFSIPLGIALTRLPRLEGVVLGVAGVVQTIPSLALLAVMVPALAALGFSGIGFLPAFLGLTLYGVLPVLRNTVTGIRGVAPELIEAARGVGMTSRQQLRLVELPLALPVIVAGVRTATVWIVGIATLSTPVGAPSLGNYIFSGLQTRNYAAVLVGCVAAAVLALALDGLVRMLEVGVRERRVGVTRAAAGLAALLAVYAGVAALPAGGGGVRPVRVGAKTFTEQYVLSEIVADVVRERAETPAEIVPSLGSTVAFDALRSGGIDLYVDYSGTLWTTVMGRDAEGVSRDAVLAGVTEYLRTTDGIEVVARLGFENAYELAMREALAAELGVGTIGQLVPHAPRLTFGADYEFLARPEWAALQRVYGLRFAGQRSMDPSLLYEAAGRGSVDVVSAFSTDGRLDAYRLRVLDDDRHAIPPYDALLLAGRRLLAERPEVIAALRVLDGAIDETRMRGMNAGVDERGVTPAAVAAGFVAQLGR
jgi:osmoprotectant transport system permease protein